MLKLFRSLLVALAVLTVFSDAVYAALDCAHGPQYGAYGYAGSPTFATVKEACEWDAGPVPARVVGHFCVEDYSAYPNGIAGSQSVTGIYDMCSPLDTQVLADSLGRPQTIRATPEDYMAAVTIFAALLLAGAVLWGSKRLYRMFDSSPD